MLRAGRVTQASQGALAAAQVALLMDFVGVADALACGATAIDFALEKGARARLPLRPESPQRDSAPVLSQRV